MPKFKVVAVIETHYELEIEAESKEDVVDLFADLEAAGEVEDSALTSFSYNPFEISSIEEIK